MGLLDDAIREHLELKRRHGADETEVSRLETEAFGSQPLAAQPADTPEPAAEPQPAPEDPEPPHGDPLEEATAPEPEATLGDEDPWLDEPDEVPPGDSLDHSSRRQPTSEFTPEDHAEATGDAAYVAPDEEPAEDLLEETPEFLQETPEHDRLWFEQKPPRDFDFGG